MRDTNRVVRHPASEVSQIGVTQVLRTELLVELARSATIGAVDAALARVGGRIEAALAQSPMLVVSIPDLGSVPVLDVLRAALVRMRGIGVVDRSLMPQPDGESSVDGGCANPLDCGLPHFSCAHRA
jgi:hypothetical protein